MVVEKNYQFPGELLNRLDFSNKKIILLTAHRRENWGKGMKNRELLENEEEYTRMARAVNPYGDGKAAKRIIAVLKKELC